MTKQTEVLKMALEALVKERTNYEDWDKEDGAPEYIYGAINAITSVLAQPEQEPVGWKLVPIEPTNEMLKAMDECSTEGYDERLYAGHAASVYMAAVDVAPNPPEARNQEPVAWLHTKIEGVAVPHRPADLDKHPDRWTALYKDPKPCPTCEALARTVMLDQTSHDTTPPQRKPLTDEEIGAILEGVNAYGTRLYTFARAIEAKLKEKNT